MKIKITNGVIVREVPKGIYESFYKDSHNWRKIDAQTDKKSGKGVSGRENTKSPSEPKLDPNYNEIPIDEIPFSEMSGHQLKEYAVRHNIDISGLRTKREVIQRFNEMRG